MVKLRDITEEELDELWEEPWCHICGITQTELNKKHKYKTSLMKTLNQVVLNSTI